MTNWSGNNRRKFPRVNYPCLVVLRDNGESHEAVLSHTENVGEGGLCVILKKNLRVFSVVDIELDLLDFEEHIKCQGKVVWNIQRRVEDNHKPVFYDIGIEFVSLPKEKEERLKNAVTRVIRAGGEPTPYT